MDAIVTPNANGQQTIVKDNDEGHYWNSGLTGKDAAFLNQGFTLEAFRALTDTVNHVARDIEVNVEKSGRASELATEKTAAAINVAMVTGFKDGALAAATNTAAILAAQAACCCELKELIREEANETRDLINALNTQNLQAQLAESKSEVSLLKLKIAGINVPI